MSITADRKQELISRIREPRPTIPGRPEVQVAILSERIKNLTEHLGNAQEGFPFQAWLARHGRATPQSARLSEAQECRPIRRADRDGWGCAAEFRVALAGRRKAMPVGRIRVTSRVLGRPAWPGAPLVVLARCRVDE